MFFLLLVNVHDRVCYFYNFFLLLLLLSLFPLFFCIDLILIVLLLLDTDSCEYLIHHSLVLRHCMFEINFCLIYSGCHICTLLISLLIVSIDIRFDLFWSGTFDFLGPNAILSLWQ